MAHHTTTGDQRSPLFRETNTALVRIQQLDQFGVSRPLVPAGVAFAPERTTSARLGPREKTESNTDHRSSQGLWGVVVPDSIPPDI